MKNHLFKIIAICGLSIPSQALSDFEVINLDKAYKQGFSGKGVEIGILDSGFVTSHPALIHRAISAPFTKDNFHGTAVASVAVGNYLNPQTHGIAYQAKFYGLINSDSNVYDFFKYKNVKTINNSWGYMIYPVLNFQLGDKGQIEKYPNPLQVKDITGFEIGSIKGLKRLAKEKKTLIVFSTGNSGFTSAAIAATLPRYDESLRSWLAVGAIDSSQITKDSNGKLKINPQGATNFGDGFKGIELFGLVAPGKDVKVAYYQGSYTTSSGTSFSSPMVSGVSALIQEKYPFLNGAQIADILLSTANQDYIAPKFVLKESIINNHAYYSVIYINHPTPMTKQELQYDLLIAGYTQDSVALILANLFPQNPIIQVSKEEVFGQGILDAQKALNGIATLDINRLNDENIFTHNDKLQGFYAFNTQGYDASFDNNISQRKWDEKYHLQDAINRPALTDETLKTLNAGLIKTGRGTLTLRGNNSYSGDTLIQGGTLALNKHSNQGGTLINSDVYVYQQGTLQGNGIISKNLTNSGIVAPGNGVNYGQLTIGETYTQNKESTLQIHFKKRPQSLYALSTPNTTHSTLTAKTYDIKGGSLLYQPYQDFYGNEERITLSLGSLATHLSEFNEVVVDPSFSQTLQFQVVEDLQTIITRRKKTAYKVSNDSLGTALQSIVTKQLNSTYQNYFTLIDTANATLYKEMIKSVDSPLYLAQTKEILHHQSSLNFEGILNSFKRSDFLLLTPNFTYIHNQSYNGTNLGLSLTGKNGFLSSNTISYFLNLSSFSLNDKPSDTSSLSFLAGMNTTFGFEFIDLFIGGGAGIGLNDFNRHLVFGAQPIQSHYQNIFAQTHIGIGKTIGSNFSFTPLAYINYQYTHQNAFYENQVEFAKTYENYHYHKLSTIIGTNINYLLQLSNLSNITFGLFANYERYLLGNELKNDVSFIDFKNEKFMQTLSINKDYFSIGLNLEWSKKAFLLKLSPSIELSNNFYAPQIALSLGAKL